MSSSTNLQRLTQAAKHTELRLRFGESLKQSLVWLPLPLLYAVGVLTWVKVFQPSEAAQTRAIWASFIPILGVVFVALRTWFKARPKHLGAIRLDQYHQLSDRVASAIAFHEIPKAERTPFMEAAIADAATTVQTLEPSKAAPIRLPSEAWLVPILLIGLYGISQLEVRIYHTVKIEHAGLEPLVVNPDDLDLFRQFAEDLQAQNKDPEVQAAIHRFNQLVEDIAHKRLDRAEVFRRLEALERELKLGTEADREALDEGLKAMAQELKKSDLAKPIAKPLEEKRLADAAEAMKKLAERLRDKQKPPTKAELDKLREALERASKANAERSKALDQAREKLEQERKQLLKKKQENKLSKQEQSLLNKKERRLERLNREKEQQERTSRQLSRLDRELAQAAEDLLKEMGASAEDLEEAAEDINRMAREEMSDQEKEQLKKRLQEMRELLRQQGQANKEQQERMKQFGQKARGGSPGEEGEEGGQGQGQGQNGPLRPGQGKGPGQGTGPGQGPGGIKLTKGSGSKGSSGQGSEAGGAGEQGGNTQGNGDQPGGQTGQGEGWGTGHDPNLKGDATKIDGNTKDVTAVAADTGQGTASSQVIHGAAQRGFVGRGYKQVYTDYQTVAEDVMRRDDIPPGYQSYVRRYFQLIRPRD